MFATQKSHDFRDKLIEFAINIIKLTKSLPKTPESAIITYQIIKSATSMGSNYTEAMFALTKADFIHCLNICKKETGETLHWLEILLRLNPKQKDEIDLLLEASQSFLRIFVSSVKTSQKNNKQSTINNI